MEVYTEITEKEAFIIIESGNVDNLYRKYNGNLVKVTHDRFILSRLSKVKWFKREIKNNKER